MIDARYLKDIKMEGMWGKEKKEVHMTQSFWRQRKYKKEEFWN